MLATRGRRVGLGGFHLDVHLALEISTFFDGDTLGHNITNDDGRFPQLGALTGPDVAFQIAVDHHALGADIRVHVAVRSDHQVVPLQLNRALDRAVDVQVFTAGKFSLDHDRFTDVRKLSGLWHLHGNSLLWYDR